MTDATTESNACFRKYGEPDRNALNKNPDLIGGHNSRGCALECLGELKVSVNLSDDRSNVILNQLGKNLCQPATRLLQATGIIDDDVCRASFFFEG